MTTVLIPTTNRPDFLRTALASVNRQTARDQIARVLVSENAGCRASGEVCAEFKDLPIQYVFRDPPVPALDHINVLLRETETELIAVLHDDDWWHPHHLANGLGYLRGDANASVYWSAFFRVTGESSWLSHWTSSFWAGAGYPPLADVWKLTFKEAALAALCCTPCHYSTLLTYKRHLLTACEVFNEQANPFDNDRIFVAELAKLGVTYFNPIPEVFVRYHPGADTLRYVETREPYVAATTDYLLDECARQGIDVKGELEALAARCPGDARRSVFHSIEPASAQAMAARGLLPPTLAKFYRGKRLKRMVRRVVPKALFTRVQSWIYG